MEEKSNGYRGMKFPPQVNPATGCFLVSEGEENVKESIYLILMTQKSERFIRPDFGSSTLSYPFTDPAPTRLHMIERDVKQTILLQEPRVSDVTATARYDGKNQSIVLEVDYELEEGGRGRVEFSI